MHDPATLARVVRQSVPLTTRFLAGFERRATEQAPSLPNHASWTLGHCALTMGRLAEKLDGQGLSASDFAEGELGDAERFGAESVAYGSSPSDDPGAYPGLERATAIFEAAAERLARAVEGASPGALRAESPWGHHSIPLGDLVVRVSFHNGMHAGQLTDLRRALALGTAAL